jgi:monoamine oxidase
MDVDGYLDVFSVVGGNEQIVARLADELDAEIRLNSAVTSVEPLVDGGYRLELLVNGVGETATADYVVVALPLASLSTIHWRSEALEIAMDKHIGYFDRPGHYLRASLLFQRPFWRDTLAADWWMLDAFDGCCVYDESARNDCGGYGVLAFLIAGNAALALANVSDQRESRCASMRCRRNWRKVRSCCWTAGSTGGWRRLTRFPAACPCARARSTIVQIPCACRAS